MDRRQLTLFVTESNKIEGILRDPTVDELDAHEEFLTSGATDFDLEDLVSVVAPGHVLRERPGLNVRVGDHRPPSGGPSIRTKLNRILDKLDELSPHLVHCLYEDLHPFTDGNGRSGRALWLWMMMRQSERDRQMARQLGFLHSFYYQTLSASDARNLADADNVYRLDGSHKKFPCKCGAEFGNVIDTRPQADGTIKRRRTCTKCHRRISTTEIPISELGVRYG